MTNELIKNDTVRLTIEKAKEHAKKIESIIIVTDDDFKIAKKEKATAKKLVDSIGSEITKNRQKALDTVEAENQIYKNIKDEIENSYKKFFENLDETKKERDLKERTEWESRVVNLIENLSLNIDLKDVDDEIFKSTKKLKTDKKLIELLKNLQADKERKNADIENIKNKAIGLELSFAKYVAMFEDGMPATDVYEKIDFDFSQLEAEISERIEKEKQRKADEQRELDRQKLIMRENEERLAKQAEELKQRELEKKQREEEELKKSVLEDKTLEVQGLTKITMTVTYEKTPENSLKLNELLTQMKEIADVKLEK
ncbi:MAG: DUF1351 domain-containing protein [Lactococcus cremoris]